MPINPDARAALQTWPPLDEYRREVRVEWARAIMEQPFDTGAERFHASTILCYEATIAAAVRAAREECAQVADAEYAHSTGVARLVAMRIRDSIRALNDAEPGGDS